MGIPFVTSVPIPRNGATAVVPEPNFPAQPDEFVGRDTQIEAFRQVLAQGLLTGRTPSFAVLGDWGVGKSSLLLKYSAICSKPEHAMLPVFFSVSTELSDYKCFAESLLDTFTRTLETSDSLTTQFRNELQKWKLSRLSIGGVSLDRQGPELSLTFHSAGNSRVHRSSVWRFAAYSSPFPMALRQDLRSSLFLGFREPAIVGPRPRFSRGP